jgi:hypothetical protein
MKAHIVTSSHSRTTQLTWAWFPMSRKLRHGLTIAGFYGQSGIIGDGNKAGKATGRRIRLTRLGSTVVRPLFAKPIRILDKIAFASRTYETKRTKRRLRTKNWQHRQRKIAARTKRNTLAARFGIEPTCRRRCATLSEYDHTIWI